MAKTSDILSFKLGKYLFSTIAMSESRGTSL